MIPCISVRKLTKYKIENCERIALTSKSDWGTYRKGGILSKVEASLNNIQSVMESFEGTDPISAELS